MNGNDRIAVALCWSQGAYFFVTGIWPLVSVDTFQLVTGRKTDHLVAARPTALDHWMLYTIAGLILAIAIVLLVAAWRRRPSLEVALLGLASAAALAAIDVIYVARGTIWPIYLADAAVEAAIIAVWCWVLASWRRTSSRS